MSGKFKKEFNTFRDGILELQQVSDSASQALNFYRESGYHNIPIDNIKIKKIETEADAIASLAINVARDRPTGNGVDWGRAEISIESDKVRYQTTGGLQFGWSLGFDDYQESREFDENETSFNKWSFWIQHPDGNQIRRNSTLRQSASRAGWSEEEI